MRSGVAHEDVCGRKVVQKEAGAAPRERAAQLHNLELFELARGQHQDQGYDRDHPGGQTVRAIEEVDGVLHADEPEDADGRDEQA